MGGSGSSMRLDEAPKDPHSIEFLMYTLKRDQQLHRGKENRMHRKRNATKAIKTTSAGNKTSSTRALAEEHATAETRTTDSAQAASVRGLRSQPLCLQSADTNDVKCPEDVVSKATHQHIASDVKPVAYVEFLRPPHSKHDKLHARVVLVSAE